MSRIFKIITILFLFFSFSLPKAGTKIGDFPLYVSVILALFFVLPVLFYKIIRNYREKEEKLFLFYITAFVTVLLAEYLFYQPQLSISKIAYDYLPIIVGITAAVFIFTAKYSKLEINTFKNVIVASFFIITIYGFIQKIFGDINTIIPGITFNYSEAVKLDPNISLNMWSKYNYNAKLNYLKLSSTYQNGNLFGVNYLLISWFALYFMKISKKKIIKVLYYLSLIAYSAICLLTASTTVYLGLALSLFLLYVISIYEIYTLKSRYWVLKLIILIVVPIAVLIGFDALFHTSKMFNNMMNVKLFQRNFLANERIIQIKIYINYLLSGKNWFAFLFGSLFTNTRAAYIYEILPASVVFNSGIIFTGIFLFYLFFFIRKLKFSVYNIGIFSYLLASLTDAGFWYPPTPFSLFVLIGFSYYLKDRF